ncbi:helix-turn-helix domain-containing protein [Amycolatopsis speibonae]|uniref:Helix-turn-helix domain-containing protein n=1 Tax=Amycolatopsis speibonae TaxID=1450224 RepID=A0ABV7PAE3_9PSEU
MDKAMLVLSALITSDVALSLTQLSQRTRLAKATVHRVLTVLQSHNMIVRKRAEYAPGYLITQHENLAGNNFLAALGVRSTPYLLELYETTGHTASISVLYGDAVHHVNQIFGHRTPRFARLIPAGAGSPIAAIEQVLHAYRATPVDEHLSTAAADELSEIRRVGLARVDIPSCGITGIAVPLSGLAHPVALALTGRQDQMNIAVAARALRQSAFLLGRALKQDHCASLSAAANDR